jgi:DNA primase
MPSAFTHEWYLDVKQMMEAKFIKRCITLIRVPSGADFLISHVDRNENEL